MPDYIRFQKSISDELISIKDRVRHFIDDSHWGEDGRYKEIILSQTIKDMLPGFASLGTGFVINGEEKTSQIDIIVYDNRYPLMFRHGDFIIATAKSVLGIIEVKTNLNSGIISDTCSSAHRNGEIISQNIFNGIFSYETDFAFNPDRRLPDSISTSLCENYSRINHIAFSTNIFMKYWSAGKPEGSVVAGENRNHYSFYELPNLSFGYFISNLIETIYCKTNISLPIDFESFLYPLPDQGKEGKRIENFEILL